MKDIRIIVEGSRGKSSIVNFLTNLLYSRGEDVVGKITGKSPKVFRNGKEKTIIRKDNSFLIDRENIAILSRHKGAKFKIFENQALSLYTMEVVHKIVKPQIIVIPNIRFEHQDSLGKNLTEIATSFAYNFKGAKKIITSENKKIVLDVFRKFCKRYGCKLIVVNDEESVPSLSSINLIDRVLKEIGLEGLSKNEARLILDKIMDKMSIKYSYKKGIYYFNGAKVNDIESSINVFDYLKQANPGKKFVFMVYLRKDRPERTESFYPFFNWVYRDKDVPKIYFTGSGLKQINANHKVIKKKDLTQEEVIDFCRKNGFVLFTAVNGVNDFMIRMEKMLE